MKRALLALVLVASIQLVRGATTNQAASPALADVQAAMVGLTNGVVIMPAGSATWTNQLVNTNGNSLIGSGTNLTFINDGFPGLTSQSLIELKGVQNSFIRVAHFSITQTNGSKQALIQIGNGSSATPVTNVFRVDHMYITNQTSGGVLPWGWAVGVVDHCWFIQGPPSSATGVRVLGEGPYGWETRPPTFGTTNMVVVEDCKFSWGGNANGAIDAYNSARYTFRYNTVTNVNIGNHGADSQGAHGAHSFEIYNNFITNAVAGTSLMFAFRAGTGPIFSNVLGGAINLFISGQSYRSSGTNIYGGTTPCCNPWGPIDGTSWGDGNILANGWPSLDQIGRTSPTTYFTNMLAPNGLANAYTVQASQIMHAWGNYKGTNPIPIFVQGFVNTGIYANIDNTTNIIVEGRDFTNGVAMPNYTPLIYPHPLVTLIDGSRHRVSGRVLIDGRVVFQ